jgi:hypothetical protein
MDAVMAAKGGVSSSAHGAFNACNHSQFSAIKSMLNFSALQPDADESVPEPERDRQKRIRRRGRSAARV